MPPRKSAAAAANKADLKPFPPRKENFTINAGFKYGSGDHPPLLNQKAVPPGKPGCLLGNKFVITGTLPSLYRDDAKALIEKYGGAVTGSISGKTDVLLAGCMEVGPKKIETAKAKNIPIIDEDGLFLIIARSEPERNKEYISNLEKDAGATEEEKEEEAAEEEKLISTDLQPATGSNTLAERYRPNDISDVIGHIGQRSELSKYLINFENQKEKIFLITGPPGVGKTTISHLVAKSCGYEISEFNASDARSKKEVEKLIDIFDNLAIISKRKTEKKHCVIFDEVDGMGANDKGGLSALIEYSKRSKIPIICIANDISDRKYDTLLKNSKHIALSALPPPQIISRLTKIIKSENLNIPLDMLKKIANNCKGDLRYAINMLQFGTSGSAETEKSITPDDVVEATRELISQKTSFTRRCELEFAGNSLPLYIQYNIPPPKSLAISDQINYADALEYSALGDVLEQELQITQNYSLSPAANFLSCVAPGLACDVDKEPGLLTAGMPKYMMTYNKYTKFEGYENYLANILGVNKDDLPICLNVIKVTFDSLVSKEKYNDIVTFLSSLKLTLDDIDHIREYMKCGKKDEFKIPKELAKAYKEQHSEIDYSIKQTAGKMVKLKDLEKKEKKENKEKKKESKEKKSKDKKDKKEKKEKKEKKH